MYPAMILNLGSAEPRVPQREVWGSPRLVVNKRKYRKTKIVVSSLTPQKSCHLKKKHTNFRV